MRVMVTGGTGFIGYHSSRALQRAGHEVCLLVRSVDKVKRLWGNSSPPCVLGDVSDAASVKRALDGCDAVLHSAAMVSTSAVDAGRVYDTNVGGTRRVVASALDQGVGAIVYVSSVVALFNPHATMLDGDSPLGNASNPYGRSKVACEEFARQLQAEGAPIAISYPATVIGPDDPGLTEPHIGLQTFLSRFVPSMPSGAQFVDVRDVAEVHCRLLERETSGGRFAVGGHYVPWRELGPLLEQLTARRLLKLPVNGGVMRSLGSLVDGLKRLVPFDLPMGREAMTYATQWVQLDSSRVESELGFTFRPLEQSLIDTIQWLCRAGHISAAQAGALAARV